MRLKFITKASRMLNKTPYKIAQNVPNVMRQEATNLVFLVATDFWIRYPPGSIYVDHVDNSVGLHSETSQEHKRGWR